MLLKLIEMEPAIGDIIFKNSDAKTTININGTCKLFNTMTREDAYLHYIEHTKTEIPKMFENLVKRRMFASCTEDEYDAGVLTISNMITDDNYTDVVDALTSAYYFYMFEAVRYASGIHKDMYASLHTKYLTFLQRINAVVGEESEEEDDIDW